VLNEAAQKGKPGIHLEEAAIPVDGQVEGACEMLGLDPLYVANEGIFIAIVSAAAADEAVRILQKEEFGRQAAVIGEVTGEHPGTVVMKSRIGGRRVVGMLPGEQLPRIC
jgi:hydrogenase expression/formation protein HypE